MWGNIGKQPYQQSWTKQQNILISDACWWIYHLVVKRSCQEHTAVATSAIRLLNWKASFQPKWCNKVIKCNICFFFYSLDFSKSEENVLLKKILTLRSRFINLLRDGSITCDKLSIKITMDLMQLLYLELGKTSGNKSFIIL